VKNTFISAPVEAAKPGNFGSLTDKRVEMVTLPLMPTFDELPAESAVSVVPNHNPIVQDDILRLVAPSPMSVENVPSPMTEESATDTCAVPARKELEVIEIAPSFVLSDGAAGETKTPPTQEASEVVELAPFPVTDDDNATRGAFPGQEAAEAEDIRFSLVTDHSATDFRASHRQETTNSKVSPALLVAGTEEELPAPSLLAFYGLNQQPFDVTPDPAYLYRSRVHREALAALSQGIEHLRGFVALVAEPGMGKTTLLNTLMEELRDSVRVVFLFQTQCNSSELLRYLLTELEIEHDGMDIVAMHRALSQALFEEMLQGRRFVLIVDEAQNLQDSVLESIRLLSDFETTHSKLIQIVLAGQPQLVETLMRPSLAQLRQRIGVLANLESLDITETAEYIEHRLRAARWSGKPLFTPDALALIAESSAGVPRSINNLCFNAMLAGYLQRQEIIDSEIVKKVASKLDLELLVRRPRPDVPSVTMNGKLNEKVRSQSWSKNHESRIDVSFERSPASGVLVADRHYCCSFYISEEQGSTLQAGKPIRIKIEQD
jgi:general secretion pathway protein A